MKYALALCLFLVTIQSDCSSEQKKDAPPKQALQQPNELTHRFTLVPQDIDLAFDTETGQLCRTWDWTPLAPEPKTTKEGRTPQRKVGEFTPTCLSIYQQVPTNANPGDPLGLFNKDQKPN